jgi:predicted SAM-dependent methyltransferase
MFPCVSLPVSTPRLWLAMKLLLKRLPLLRDPAIRHRLKQLPGVRHTIRAVRRMRRRYYSRFGQYHLQKNLAKSKRKRVVIGAWSRYDAGWIPTQREFLDLTKPSHWERSFQPDSVDALLAEHVWEHLTPEEGLAAARTCYRYLRPGGYLRVAVPDGLHPDPEYIETVKAGAPGVDTRAGEKRPEAATTSLHGNAANHKALYSYRTLKELFESAGFQVKLYEYFDEGGTFHCHDWNRELGTIWRSKRFDPRNKNGNLTSVYPGSLGDYLSYSSIILDAIKK